MIVPWIALVPTLLTSHMRALPLSKTFLMTAAPSAFGVTAILHLCVSPGQGGMVASPPILTSLVFPDCGCLPSLLVLSSLVLFLTTVVSAFPSLSLMLSLLVQLTGSSTPQSLMTLNTSCLLPTLGCRDAASSTASPPW